MVLKVRQFHYLHINTITSTGKRASSRRARARQKMKDDSIDGQRILFLAIWRTWRIHSGERTSDQRTLLYQNMSAHERHQMHEQVSNVITSFLKQRKYTDSESSLKEFPVEQKMEDLVFKATVCNESGVPDVFSFAINNSDPAMLDEQFSNLKSFITGTNQAYRLELSKFLFPLFANIYLDLVVKGQAIAAQSLFSKHSGDFLIEHKEEIQHLQAITELERLKSSDTASNFRRSKFVVKLSNKVFTYFLQYLRSADHVLLLHLLNKHFSIEISHSKPGQKQNSDEVETDETEASTVNYRTTKGAKQARSNTEKENENLVALRESIGHIRNGPACLPSVCFYSFLNAHQGYGFYA